MSGFLIPQTILIGTAPTLLLLWLIILFWRKKS
jgi:hypothetical protein